MCICCSPNYCGTNPRYTISALMFSPAKSPGDRSQLSPSLSDWSDPGELTFVSYPRSDDIFSRLDTIHEADGQTPANSKYRRPSVAR